MAEPDRLRRLTNVVKGMPRVTREYKAMTLFADALIDYLEARCREVDSLPATTAHRARKTEGRQALAGSVSPR